MKQCRNIQYDIQQAQKRHAIATAHARTEATAGRSEPYMHRRIE